MYLQQKFNSNGYVLLKNVFSLKDQENLIKVLREIIEAKAPFIKLNKNKIKILKKWSNDRLIKIDNLNHNIIKIAYEALPYTKVAKKLFWKPKLIKAVSKLIGCKSNHLYIAGNRLRIDPPGSKPYRIGWHQEFAYMRHAIKDNKSLQIWSPFLFPSNLKNGSIEIAINSHKKGLLKHKYISTVKKNYSEKIFLQSDVIKKFKKKIIKVKNGDVFIFNPYVAHRSSDAISQKNIKLTLIARYFDITKSYFSPPGTNLNMSYVRPKKIK